MPPNIAAIFQALADGDDLPRVLEKFHLSREQLNTIFQEVARYYRDLEQGQWTLYCDGASSGNPGPAGAGFILIDPDGEIRLERGDYLGEATNNVAEYRGLILGLKATLNLGVQKIQVYSDSELLVRQLNRIYRVKAPHLIPLYQEARKELQKFRSYAISHVPRDRNWEADRLARQAIDRKGRTM
ncbi:MAG: ribonuclease HI family protein [Deltaproteobacteria bacterium]|nr:ribonuclease HI family protein [Deltaproteobacteria bacterium]